MFNKIKFVVNLYTMKAICILRLILFTVFLYGNSGLKSDIIIFGHNYTGDLKDGKRDGIGKYNYPNGDTYEGMWVNNKKEGEGILTYNNDRYTYIGTFKNDLFNGWGTLYIIGGEKYEGIGKMVKWMAKVNIFIHLVILM